MHTDPTMLHARWQPVEAEKVNVSTHARDSALQDKNSNEDVFDSHFDHFNGQTDCQKHLRLK